MASMVTLATTAVPDWVRGALSRWFIEVAPGLYVGTVSARVRDKVWDAVSEVVKDGAAVLAYPDNNEQGFSLRTAGSRRRIPTDFDGLTLVTMQAPESAKTEDIEKVEKSESSEASEPRLVWPEGW